MADRTLEKDELFSSFSVGTCSGQVQCVRFLLCESKVKSYLKRNCLLKSEKNQGSD